MGLGLIEEKMEKNTCKMKWKLGIYSVKKCRISTLRIRNCHTIVCPRSCRFFVPTILAFIRFGRYRGLGWRLYRLGLRVKASGPTWAYWAAVIGFLKLNLETSIQAAWKRMVVLVGSLSVLDQTHLNGTMVILIMTI